MTLEMETICHYLWNLISALDTKAMTVRRACEGCWGGLWWPVLRPRDATGISNMRPCLVNTPVLNGV